VSVSVAGIVAPFLLGGLIALAIHADGTMFRETVTTSQAVLYLGAAMSITAFPMLARIVHERGLSGTSLGTLALAAGSIDDAAAWCVLAVVLASLGNAPMIAVAAIGGGIVYTLAVLLGLRPALLPLGRRVERSGAMSYPMLSVVLTLVMLGSWYTDRIGIYAVYGAFILGAAMPRGKFADELQRLLTPLTTGLLLPLFFVYSGLNTRIELVNTWSLVGIAALVLIAACVGKGVACWLAARLNGEPRDQALAIGALMNTRGLMELIILNIGYERGIITQTLFSIMVMMALVTTLMATPLFELVYGRRGRLAGTVGAVHTG
jgi:Kef-type K+ transport system membrane component KefB